MAGTLWYKNAPCMNCNERYVNPESGYTCHSECAAYLAYRAGAEEVYDVRKKQMELNSYNLHNVKKRKHEVYRKQKR